MTTETQHRALSAEHLTDVLRRAGAVPGGRVSRVDIESSREVLLSRIVRVRLAYEGSAADAPERLFLKTAYAGSPFDVTDAGRKEVEFYDHVAAVMPARLVPRCFEAAWEAEAKHWHLLFEDLTDSHATVAEWPLPPTDAQCERIVDTYARFHASWWNDPRLGTSIGAFLDTGALDAFLRELPGPSRSTTWSAATFWNDRSA
jgi:hypothetical protein